MLSVCVGVLLGVFVKLIKINCSVGLVVGMVVVVVGRLVWESGGIWSLLC